MDIYNTPIYKTPIRVKGYHPEENPERNYKEAKIAVHKGFTEPDYKPPTPNDIKNWIARGGWVGHLVPEDCHVIDSEDDDRIAYIRSVCKQKGITPAINHTNNGLQFWFRLNGGEPLNGSSKVTTRCGVPVTYRAAKKNYTINPPTNGRYWENEEQLENLPALPDEFRPMRNTRNNLLNAISWALGEAYRKELLAGYDDIDAGFMALLIECGIPGAQILEAFKLVFPNDYDERRTLMMYQRTLDRKTAGEALHGVGSLIQSLKDKGFDSIATQVKKFERLAVMIEDVKPHEPPKNLSIDDTTLEDGNYQKILESIADGESGFAELVTKEWKDKLRFDGIENQWFTYKGHSWKKIQDEAAFEDCGVIKNKLKEAAIYFAQKKIEAEDRGDKSLAKDFWKSEKLLLNAIRKIGELYTQKAVMCICHSDLSYLGYIGQWDANPYLVGTPNGVLNLEDLTFKDGKPQDKIRTTIPTKWQGVTAQAPLWKKSLLEIFDGNEDIVAYVQRVFGYCLSGLTRHHHLWILEGKGRNGKSLIFKILNHTLGDLIGILDRELLLDKRHHRQSGSAAPDVLNLRGKRMVFLIETSEGRRFDAGKVKLLSGGDLLHGRGLYARDYSTFENHAKPFVLTNSRPHISGSDYAALQRIILLPFNVSFIPEPDPDPRKKERLANPNLEEELKSEAPGILAWLVEGYLMAHDYGLIPPDCIEEATNEYREEEDTIGRFVAEKLEQYAGSETRAGEIYEAYRGWCEAEGQKPKHNSIFGREMRNHAEAIKKGNLTYYVNIRIRT